jgi:hypothetical protein
VDQLAKSTDLALAKVHARKIFKRCGKKTFTNKWKPEPAVLQWAANLLEDGQQLSSVSAKYVAAALRIYSKKLSKKHGRYKEADLIRNSVIITMLLEMQRFGFQPTRTPDVKKHNCGCSIVAEVLDGLGVKSERGGKFSEAAVVKVWENFNKKLKQERLKWKQGVLVKLLQQPEKAPGLFAEPPSLPTKILK